MRESEPVEAAHLPVEAHRDHSHAINNFTGVPNVSNFDNLISVPSLQDAQSSNGSSGHGAVSPAQHDFGLSDAFGMPHFSDTAYVESLQGTLSRLTTMQIHNGPGHRPVPLEFAAWRPGHQPQQPLPCEYGNMPMSHNNMANTHRIAIHCSLSFPPSRHPPAKSTVGALRANPLSGMSKGIIQRNPKRTIRGFCNESISRALQQSANGSRSRSNSSGSRRPEEAISNRR